MGPFCSDAFLMPLVLTGLTLGIVEPGQLCADTLT